MQHWLRKIRVTFKGGGGSLVVNPGIETDNQLTVSVSIEKSISGKANDAVVRIHNLKQSSRNSIGSEFTDVIIEAGYIPPPSGPDLTGIIFEGQIRDFTHDREGAEIVTTVTVGDGDKALRKSTISKTYPAGTPKEAVMEDIYGKYAEHGVKKGEWLFPPMEPFIRPYSIAGTCSRYANELGRYNGFYWSIQNQVMEVIPSDKYLPLVTLLNRDTGMVHYPKITDNGVRVSALLNPEVRPNRLIAVKSEAVPQADGEYRVGRIDYSLDNRDGDFYMHIHGERAVGGVVDEGKK